MDGADTSAFMWARLEELGRLRAIGVKGAERIGLCFEGALSAEEARIVAGKDGLPMEFWRTTRAVRQVIVLEMELLGLRAAPDRDGDPDAPRDFDEIGLEPGNFGREPRDPGIVRNDGGYMYGPMEEVVARIRKDLRAEAPPNDPFAPRPAKAAAVKTVTVTETETEPPKHPPPDGKAEPKAKTVDKPNVSSGETRGGFARVPSGRAEKRKRGRLARAARKANRAKARGRDGQSGRGRDPPG